MSSSTRYRSLSLRHRRLHVLPRRNGPIVRDRRGIKAQTVVDIARGDGRVPDVRKHLPALGVGGVVRAGHEAGSAPAGVRVVAVGLAGVVGEGAEGGARGRGDGVRLGEGQRALGGDVDLLAAGDFDVLESR